MAFPKSHGPPPREPPPSWVVPASQRQHDPPAILRARGWEIQTPRSDVPSVVQTIVESESQLQSHLRFAQFQNQHLQFQLHQLQTQQPMASSQYIRHIFKIRLLSNAQYQIGLYQIVNGHDRDKDPGKVRN